MEEEKPKKPGFKASNYGEVLAAILKGELIEYKEIGSYQGDYFAVIKLTESVYYGESREITRYFTYAGSYGSCSGCDWLEDVRDWETDEVPLEEALKYVSDSKPLYITPTKMTFERLQKLLKIEDEE